MKKVEAVKIEDVKTIRFTDVWNEKGDVCIGITFVSKDERSKYDYHHGLLMEIEYAEKKQLWTFILLMIQQKIS